MAALSRRRARIIVNTTAIEYVDGEGFDLSFSVQQTNRIEPSTSTAVIRNLPKAVRERLTNEYNRERARALEKRLAEQGKPIFGGENLKPGTGPAGRMRIEAGYVDTMSLLSQADITKLEHVRADDGDTWETRIEAQDGYVPWRYGFVNEDMGTGVDISDLMRLLTASFKAAMSSDSEATMVRALTGYEKKKVANGYIFHGPTQRVMNGFLDSLGVRAIFLNGEVVLIDANKTRLGEAVVLNPATGLVDPLEELDLGKLRARSLLQAKIEPHRQVLLQDADLRPIGGGVYRCDAVTHTGDTAGDDWTSVANLRPTDL